jgi:hypothetical protein
LPARKTGFSPIGVGQQIAKFPVGTFRSRGDRLLARDLFSFFVIAWLRRFWSNLRRLAELIRDLPIERTTLTFGINNIFDTRPPFSSDWYQGYDPQNTNYIQRFFWVCIDKKF